MTIVTGRLESAGLAYMVTGSIAANYYAVPRMTRDIDIVVDLSAREADPVCALFERDFYLDRDAVHEAIASRGIFNMIHGAHVVKVDLIVRKDSEYRREEFGRRRRASVEGHEFAIVAPEDLIISKLDWARDTRSEVQLSDVRNLLISIPDLDRDYLGRWSERLGLGDLYREATR
ncbi:MAG: nucleotidyl transferase AbiEii/AbiGii toxin family protein [Candidatus Rokuibacteriota bacterium]